MDKCIGCGREIARGETTWEEMTGWARNRNAGGTNYVALRKKTGRVACDRCITLRKAGLSHRQETLG